LTSIEITAVVGGEISMNVDDAIFAWLAQTWPDMHAFTWEILPQGDQPNMSYSVGDTGWKALKAWRKLRLLRIFLSAENWSAEEMKVAFPGKPVSEAAIADCVSAWPALEVLFLDVGLPVTRRILDALDHHCPHLTQVALDNSNSQFCRFAGVPRQFGGDAKAADITAFIRHHPRLSELETAAIWPGLDSEQRDPLAYTHESMQAIADTCPNWTVLDLEGDRMVEEKTVIQLLRNCPRLVTLRLSHVSTVSDALFVSMVKEKPADVKSIQWLPPMRSLWMLSLDVGTSCVLSDRALESLGLVCPSLRFFTLKMRDDDDEGKAPPHPAVLGRLDITIQAIQRLFANCLDLETFHLDLDIPLSTPVDAGDILLLIGLRPMRLSFAWRTWTHPHSRTIYTLLDTKNVSIQPKSFGFALSYR
jgi:hypothetical protein